MIASPCICGGMHLAFEVQMEMNNITRQSFIQGTMTGIQAANLGGAMQGTLMGAATSCFAKGNHYSCA